jgi:hypothetical protein
MRVLMAALMLAALVAVPGRTPAGEPDDEPTSEEIVRRQIEALHDLDQAETDEEAEEAQRRFDAAAALEVKRRREAVDDLIEGGAPLPSSKRPAKRP